MFDSMVRSALTTCLVGASVKLMDDRLDVLVDRENQVLNWSDRLGRADLPYALLLFSLSVALSQNTALCLFFASYAMGMAHAPANLAPTRLPYWAESISVLLLGTVIGGWRLQVGALCVVGSLQLLDNVRDRHLRRLRTLVPFGVTEQLLGAATLGVAGLVLLPGAVVGAFGLYGVHEYMAFRHKRGADHEHHPSHR